MARTVARRRWVSHALIAIGHHGVEIDGQRVVTSSSAHGQKRQRLGRRSLLDAAVKEIARSMAAADEAVLGRLKRRRTAGVLAASIEGHIALFILDHPDIAAVDLNVLVAVEIHLVFGRHDQCGLRRLAHTLSRRWHAASTADQDRSGRCARRSQQSFSSRRLVRRLCRPRIARKVRHRSRDRRGNRLHIP